MRLSLALALVLLAPSGASVGACAEPYACAGTESTQFGSGSCEEGQSSYEERRAARVVLTDGTRRVDAGVWSQCVASDGQIVYRYRDLVVGAHVDSGTEELGSPFVGIVWWREAADTPEGEHRACSMDVHADQRRALGCPLGPPPLLPALP